jgi:outer membrane protein TolC
MRIEKLRSWGVAAVFAVLLLVSLSLGLRREQAVAAAQRSLDISLNQYRAGLVSYLQVATQQTALLTNQRAALSVMARRYAAAVQLVRALGGGWNAK